MIARRFALSALSALVVLIWLRAAPARADAAADNILALRAKAAEHFKQGRVFFQLGDYERALAEYQAALDLTAEPLLIFNIALCHDRANQAEQALQSFRRYVELAPDGAVADEAREDIARLTPIVDQIVAERAAEQARQREQAARLAAAPKPAPPGPSRVARYVVVAGAVVAAAGAAAHVLAWRTRTRMTEAPDPDAYYADRDTFQRDRAIAIGGYAAGALTIATGVVLGYVLRPRTGLELSAAVAPGAAALMVGWSR